MIKLFKQWFSSPCQEKHNFSAFFNRASVEEQRKLMEDVTHKANQDQRALLQQYEKAHQKTV